MALSEQSRSAFMRAAAILAQGKAPAEREVIFRNAQSYADRGSWIPAITAEQFPVLFCPGDTQRQATLAEAIRNAQEVGELSRPGPSEPQGLWPLQWAAWPGLPPVPTDSPLIYWLPEWLPSAAARLETTTAASPTEPAPAGGANAAVDGPPPLTSPQIADAFNGIGDLSEQQWRARLGEPPKWLDVERTRASIGTAPKPSTWWPLELARILTKRGVAYECLNRKFVNERALKPWLPKWQAERRECNGLEQ